MSLHVPRHFAADEGAARELIAAHPFATLVTATADDTFITHIPLLLDADGSALRGHVARVNPHWKAFAAGRTSAVFHGPHAYVSPTWYESPAENVPTWNYAVAHVHGTPEVLDAALARAMLLELTRAFEPPRSTYAPGARLDRMLPAIVAFRMPIERVEVSLKMNQNKTGRDRAGVIAGLRATGRPGDAAVADWMQAHADG